MTDSTVIEHRVYGPPGTGKTTWLRNQTEKWAREYGSDNLMVASFTRAAAHEIASRDLPINRRQVGTLHSFCYRALGGPDIAEPHVREFNDAHPSYRLTADEHGGLDVDEPVEARFGSTEGDKLMARREVLRARMVPEDEWPTGVRGFHHVWETWKAETGRVDFTDLISLCREQVGYAPGVPSIGLFDETQDFTPLELDLVRRWGARMEMIVLAGDDDQVLYSFKGATPDAFLDPPIPDDRRRVLVHSHRVPRAVHAVADGWVRTLTRREPKDYEPRDADGLVRGLERATFRSPARIVDDACAQIDAGRSCMILATCSYMIDPVKSLLKKEGIPFHNPYRRKRGDWNPLQSGSARRRTASYRLLAYLRTQPSVWGDEHGWYSGEDLRSWVEVLRTQGLLTKGAKARAESLPGVEDVDLDVFDGLWDENAADYPATLDALNRADLDWFADHLLASRARPFDFPLRVARRHGAARLRETPLLTIGTIHSVKGGEAQVVYLMPDLPPPAHRDWEMGGEHRDSIIRQMYVGMTRASEELVFCDRATMLSVDPRRMMMAGAA